MAEEVLISIRLEKTENERQVDAYTQKITALTKANKDLKKSNDELIAAGQENSKEYQENTRQLEINKQKINEAVSSRKNLITTLIAEDDSIKGLKARNAELIKQRDQLSTSTEAGREAIAKINHELDENNKKIIDNSSALEKQKFNIGNYKSALDGLIPGLGGFIDGVQGATKASLTFIATPLGAILGTIGVALAAVTAYFKGSEEGQNKFNKLAAVGSAILEQFMNVLEGLGEVIVSVFEDPQTAIKNFGKLIVENITNRLEGMLELIPQLSKAIGLLFEGNFAEAGQVAFDAVAKVTVGVEGATEKIKGLINETIALVDEGVRMGQIIADLNAKIDRDERELITSRAKTALEVSKLREQAIQQEGDTRRKTINEAIALEQALSDKEVEAAKTRLQLRQTELQANGDDKEAKKAVAEATAAVFAAETTAFQNTLRFRKELRALDEEEIKRNEEKLKAAQQHAAELQKLEDETEKAELARFERLRAAEEELRTVQLEEEVKNAQTIQERVDAEIALGKFKLETFLNDNILFEQEKQAAIAQSEAQILDIRRKAAADQKKLDDQTLKLKELNQKQELQGAYMVANAGLNLLNEVFGENKAFAAAQAGLNTAQGITNALAMSGPPWVGIAMSIIIGALGAVQLARIAGIEFAKGGLLMTKALFGLGGELGGLAVGPSHAHGGIPGMIRSTGQPIEFEGGEAIINRRSTAMFRNELSAINQAGGGVPFGRGGIPSYQTGSVLASTQTRSSAQAAETRQSIRDSVLTFMENLPPIVVTVEDINAKSEEVAEQTNRAIVV